MMEPRLVVAASLLFILAGCAAPTPKYVLQNDSQPYAEIKSAIQGANDRNESIKVYVMGEGGCGFFNVDHINNQHLLFSIKKSNAEPQGYVRVAVDRPLRLRYYEEAAGGRVCEIMIEASLEAGKKYALNGGVHYKDGFIPALLVSRSCSLGVSSETEAQQLAIKQLNKGTLCDK